MIINDIKYEYREGESFDAALMRCAPELYQSALAVMTQRGLMPLSELSRADDVITIVTYFDEDGRRIYERTLRLVLLAAIDEVFPGRRVRIENSLRGGIYLTIDTPEPLTEADVAAIESVMRRFVADRAPITTERIDYNRAVELAEKKGWYDKSRLLKQSGRSHVDVHTLGGITENFYGVMLPDAGRLTIFGLRLHSPGCMLLLPDRDDDNRHTAAYKPCPRLEQTLRQVAEWNDILGCTNAADLNDIILNKGFRELIRVNEALHEHAIAGLAQGFVTSGARVLLIAGPSSSGKTTFTHRMAIALRVLGRRPVLISLDNYYKNHADMTPGPDGSLDFESLTALNVDAFNRDINALLDGREVRLPEYDFTTGTSREGRRVIRLEPDQPVIIEGIHGLNDDLSRGIPADMKYRIYISALNQLNIDDHNRMRTTDMRLIRRLVRDYQFRASAPEETLNMWPDVVFGENQNIFPYQESADAMFNSSLLYELPILRQYAEPLLRTITPDSRHYTKARRLMMYLNSFLPVNVNDEIPGNSILREFIGDCCFYKDE